jgi:hypothetical protein
LIQNSTIQNNLAAGGKGSNHGNGGYAFGGGLYVDGGTATLLGTTITGNVARGGTKGPKGSNGNGLGGGIYIYPSSGSLVYLDAFTVDHVMNNKADYYPNID